MKILVADDHLKSLESIIQGLNKLGHAVDKAADGLEAWEKILTYDYQIVISDIRMPGLSGMELLTLVRDNNIKSFFIIITAYGDMSTSIQALRLGAFDYLIKPVELSSIVSAIQRIESHYNKNNLRIKGKIPNKKYVYYDISGIGRIAIISEKFKTAIQYAEKIHADRSLPVIIEGDTGTGKEIIARYIHYGKNGCSKPFVALNCAAIPSSVFESELFGYEGGAYTGASAKGGHGKLDLADGGTLFLDEISELPIDLQAKLLRVIEERNYFRVGGNKLINCNIRIVCATNQPLLELVKRKLFREDLYYRLACGTIRLAPLRERTEAIVPIVKMFLDEIAGRKNILQLSIVPSAVSVLLNHDWPGNLRELKNVVEWAALLCEDGVILPNHINIDRSCREGTEHENRYFMPYSAILDSACLPDDRFDLDAFEDRLIDMAISKNGGNIAKTAKYLNISRSRIYYRNKLKK